MRRQDAKRLSVQINPVSASLKVDYDEDKIDATIVHGILLKLLGLDELFDRPLESFAQRELKLAGGSFNRKVYNTTAGLLDFTSALSLSIFLFGLYMILVKRDRSLPSGFNLLWWAYVIFNSQR